MKNSVRLLLCFLVVVLSCCHKTDPISTVDVVGEKRSVGTPIGNVVSKSIGAEGGVLELPDHSVTVNIPEGALNSATNVSIQPISNTNLAGLGHAFRLTPHGSQFQKPVTVSFSYAASKDTAGNPFFLGLAYQDSAGVWQFLGGCSVDSLNKTVSYQTTHFSDWSLMRWMSLIPVEKTLSGGDQLTIEAVQYIPYPDPDNIVPIPLGKGYPVGYAQALDKRRIRKWALAGNGSLSPSGSSAGYKAPDNIIVSETAAASCELNSTYHSLSLVCNIKLVPTNNFEMRIDGGEWKSYAASCFSYQEGLAGIAFVSGNESFSMYFPASVGSQEWDGVYGSHKATFNYWPNGTTTSATVYKADYYDGSNGLHDSGGSVIITEFGDVGKYVTGTFLCDPCGYYTASTAKQIDTHKIEGRFHLKRVR